MRAVEVRGKGGGAEVGVGTCPCTANAVVAAGRAMDADGGPISGPKVAREVLRGIMSRRLHDESQFDPVRLAVRLIIDEGQFDPVRLAVRLIIIASDWEKLGSSRQVRQQFHNFKCLQLVLHLACVTVPRPLVRNSCCNCYTSPLHTLSYLIFIVPLGSLSCVGDHTIDIINDPNFPIPFYSVRGECFCLIVLLFQKISLPHSVPPPPGQSWSAADTEIKVPSARGPRAGRKVPPVKSRAGQNTAMHASATTGKFFVFNIYLPSPFNFVFPKPLPSFSSRHVQLKAGSCLSPKHRKGHPAFQLMF